MTVNAKLYVIAGGKAGNHALGYGLKDAGVSIAAGVATLDTSQTHRLRPLGPDGTTTLTLPAGYTKPCGMVMCNLSRDSVAPGATHTKFSSYATGIGGGQASFTYSLTEDTSRKWTFTVCGTIIPGQYTPSGTHHVMLCVTKVASGAYSVGALNPSDVLWVTILIDKSVWFNDAITASNQGDATKDTPVFGQSTTVGSSPTFTVSDVVTAYSDRANPLGKVTIKEWGYTLAATPPTGHDQATKSTGTDAAALIDERPPAGSGTTDADYFQLVDDGTHLSQHNALTNTLLAAGDVLYACALKIWMRANIASKLTGAAAQMHDGTTNLRYGGNVLVTGISSYAEDLCSGPAPDGGANQDAIFNTAPDATAFQGKANAYLDGCFAGAYMNGSTANAAVNVDALLTEAAIVLSGDTVSAFSDPGAGFTVARRRGGVV